MKAKNVYKLLMLLLISVIIMFMSSCASTTYLHQGEKRFTTSIKCFGNLNDIKNKTFYIESGDDNVSSNDVEFKEYAGYLVENLKGDGLIETTDKTNADLCILMNYCVTDQSYQESIPVPEYGRTTIASSKTEGNKTTYQYDYGKTGYHYVQTNVSNFVRVVNVYAYDNKSRDGEPIMLWKLNLESKGSSDNLKRVIPYMFFIQSGIVGYFDENNVNEDNLVFYVYENDMMFKRWRQKQVLSNPNFYVSCKGNMKITDGDSFCDILYVEKQNNETVVGFIKGGCRSYSIPSELYLVCNGKQTKISFVDGCQLGSRIKNECGYRYIVLHFPFELGDNKSFEIREYTNSMHTRWKSWGTVNLK